MAGSFDILGKSRVAIDRVDMGAYEWQPPRGTVLILR
jgi:hypothetical protein